MLQLFLCSWSFKFFIIFLPLLLFLVAIYLFIEKVSLCSLDCPGTCSIDWADLELRDLPAVASQVLGIKGVHPMAGSWPYLCASILKASTRLFDITKGINTFQGRRESRIER